jgi:hypothetical protein
MRTASNGPPQFIPSYRLYEDWSSLECFQRTRGVLRLMNTVIHALWVGEDQSPLIMPGSIPIGTAAVNSELTQYLQDSWKAVIDADVDGPNAEPVKIDAGKPLFGQRSLTRRLARTVFFGAAPTIGSAHKGLEAQRVFLGTAAPGDVPGNLASQAKTRAGFAGVHVCPEDAADVPDIDEARLVILHAKLTHTRGVGDSDGSPSVLADPPATLPARADGPEGSPSLQSSARAGTTSRPRPKRRSQ